MANLQADKGGKAFQQNPLSWMITFSDLVTLLLTFFVMIICITTQDVGSLMGAFDKSDGRGGSNDIRYFSNRAPLVPLINLVENLEKLPEDALFDQEEIKAALFQLDPAGDAEYERLAQAVKEEVEIFKDERGLVIRWDQELLFPEGAMTLAPGYDLILKRMAAFLASITLPVSVEGHSDPFSSLEGGHSIGAYKLSMKRAELFMKYFLALGLEEKRFRIAGHGGEDPLVVNDPSLFKKNGRIEIIIYKPKENSWRG